MSAKSCAACVWGRLYGIAAAIGKTGAFIGTYIFPMVSYFIRGASKHSAGQIPFRGSRPLLCCDRICCSCCRHCLCLSPKIRSGLFAFGRSTVPESFEGSWYKIEKMGTRVRHEPYDVDNGKNVFQLRTIEEFE